jgi:hypothetical protein
VIFRVCASIGQIASPFSERRHLAPTGRARARLHGNCGAGARVRADGRRSGAAAHDQPIAVVLDLSTQSGAEGGLAARDGNGRDR